MITHQPSSPSRSGEVSFSGSGERHFCSSVQVQGLDVASALLSQGFFLHDRSRWLDEMAENPGKRPEEPEDRPRTCSDLLGVVL
jgi:hypothetical protein